MYVCMYVCMYVQLGVAGESRSQRPMKTLRVSCENVPALARLGALSDAAGGHTRFCSTDFNHIVLDFPPFC